MHLVDRRVVSTRRRMTATHADVTELVLECGHSQWWLAGEPPPATIICNDCTWANARLLKLLEEGDALRP